MKLSIISINYNNATGLQKTIKSLLTQTLSPCREEDLEVEHIIIDGASTDGSVDIIRNYAESVGDKAMRRLGDEERRREGEVTDAADQSAITVRWVSEPDSGIYNAMNKGIEIALGHRDVDSFNRSTIGDKTKGGSAELGHYIQILNSGDIFASNDVLAKVRGKIEEVRTNHGEYPEMMYGNMIKKDYATGKIIGKSGKVPWTLRNYYTSTMNHDCCWIQAQLFDEDYFGLYDEHLRIVSDWKWFLCAIALGINPNRQMVISPIRPVYVDIDMTIFDASGISEQNLALRNQERRQVLEELLPPAILADYDAHAFDMEQMDRLRKHPWAYKLVWTLERVLNRLDHRNFSKRKK